MCYFRLESHTGARNRRKATVKIRKKKTITSDSSLDPKSLKLLDRKIKNKKKQPKTQKISYELDINVLYILDCFIYLYKIQT